MRSHSAQSPGPSELTPREEFLIRLPFQGLSNRDIAKRLQLQPGTVRNGLSRLYRKLDMKNRTELVGLF